MRKEVGTVHNAGGALQPQSVTPVIAASAATGKKDVPIVFCADANYGLYLPVVVQSIIENASDKYHYHIIILDCGIASDVVGALEWQIRLHDNFSLHVKNIENWLEEHKALFKTHNYWSAATYGRFMIPELCSGYEKVIYADIDMVFNRDIAKLMHIDLGDNYIAAALDIMEECRRYIEPKHEKYLQEKLGLEENNVCINAGLIVLNIALWQKDNLVHKLFELLGQKTFNLLDQDALCSLCKGKIYVLETVWNSLAWPKHYIDKLQVRVENKKVEYIAKITREYLQIYASNNTVFHYNTAEKPWSGMAADKADLWWSYAVKTQFFGRYFANALAQFSEKVTGRRDDYKLFGLLLLRVKRGHRWRNYLLGGKICIAKLQQGKENTYFYLFGLKCFSKKQLSEKQK